MIGIEYPHYNFKTRLDGEKRLLFDEVRRIWVVLTPEEWVRQNFIQYLAQTKGYPTSVMAVEKMITLGEMKKRCDIVIYREAKPWMIVECKEMNVPLSENVAGQILRYNISLNVRYLIVTNGSYTFGLDTGSMKGLTAIPDFGSGV
ncbi:type I restriction enzyme HsdR N-terminal domain-containing protein [Filimonas effusa]|uniref:Type I restriction enzyme HsdR N-terminal domain-containing protein n=1 Tax=Filimonas effusa TaxID=2508721 RepID=A0A4Q1DCE8_9BACT|nr:type I restriction enzyme HsdR N-terminal domain-containing protein [Filimonas effusa]RXK87137.1 type I restriction enzyme HsdR N-terminal domain-containing protein [Filimonas effusa]